MHISSSYAKILGEKLFRTWEFPRSGSKAKDGGNAWRTQARMAGQQNTLEHNKSRFSILFVGFTKVVKTL